MSFNIANEIQDFLVPSKDFFEGTESKTLRLLDLQIACDSRFSYMGGDWTFCVFSVMVLECPVGV